VNGGMISAQCEMQQGTLKSTSLPDTSNCSDISNQNGDLTRSHGPVIGPPMRLNRIEVCCEKQPPSGYIKFNDSLGGNCQNSFSHPVCDYVDYTTVPAGHPLLVCVSAPAPQGWRELSRAIDETKCQNDIPHNAAPSYQNLKNIVH
jgi:hypothetical protein